MNLNLSFEKPENVEGQALLLCENQNLFLRQIELEKQKRVSCPKNILLFREECVRFHIKLYELFKHLCAYNEHLGEKLNSIVLDPKSKTEVDNLRNEIKFFNKILAFVFRSLVLGYQKLDELLGIKFKYPS